MSSKQQQAGSALVTDIAKFIRRYIVVGDHELEVLSHFPLHTQQFSERCETPYTTPYLYIHSAQRGSGKTLLGFDILGTLVRNFQGVNNVTTATLFRLTESGCTLGIDEVDNLFNGTKANDDLVGCINTGYRRGGYVPRYDKNAEDEIRKFHTFGPKILVGIDNGLMKDTTRERCIPIHMHRATDSERKTVETFYSYRVEDEVEALNQRQYDWSFENSQNTRDYDPEVIESLSPRQWEIAMPLLQLARKTGREQQMREALTHIFTEQAQPENSPEMDMLFTLQEMMEGEKAIKSAEFLARLQSDPRFKNWTGKMLGTKLSPFGIKVKPVRFGSDVQRAIRAEDCVDAFSRYIG